MMIHRLLLLALFAASSVSLVHAQVTYDLRTQWSDTTNPNSPWTYAHNGTAMANHGNLGIDAFGTPQPGWWSLASNAVPVWFQANQTLGANDWQAGDILTHTPTGSGYSDVQWTSPLTGTVDVTGAVWAVRDIGRSNGWSLYLNSTLLVSGTVASGDPYSRSAPSTFVAASGGSVLDDLAVTAGDVLHLRLTTTGPGDYVGVEFTVTAIPEPSTYVLLVGCAALAYVCRRRRAA